MAGNQFGKTTPKFNENIKIPYVYWTVHHLDI